MLVEAYIGYYNRYYIKTINKYIYAVPSIANVTLLSEYPYHPKDKGKIPNLKKVIEQNGHYVMVKMKFLLPALRP